MNVERIGKEHLAAVAALEASVFHAPWSEQALELLTGESAFGFAVMENGAALCYGGMLTVLDEGQITNVATHQDHRRRGYADAVLTALLAEARARDLVEITLEVRESNAAAIALYERHGFSVVGRRPRFYSHPVETALVMSARLGAQNGD